MTAYRKLVLATEPTFEHASAVDTNPIRASQVANHQVITYLGNTAMATRNLAGIDLNIAFGVPADQHDRLIQQNAGPFRQGHELCRHETAHSTATLPKPA